MPNENEKEPKDSRHPTEPEKAMLKEEALRASLGWSKGIRDDIDTSRTDRLSRWTDKLTLEVIVFAVGFAVQWGILSTKVDAQTAKYDDLKTIPSQLSRLTAISESLDSKVSALQVDIRDLRLRMDGRTSPARLKD